MSWSTCWPPMRSLAFSSKWLTSLRWGPDALALGAGVGGAVGVALGAAAELVARAVLPRRQTFLAREVSASSLLVGHGVELGEVVRGDLVGVVDAAGLVDWEGAAGGEAGARGLMEPSQATMPGSVTCRYIKWTMSPTRLSRIWLS